MQRRCEYHRTMRIRRLVLDLLVVAAFVVLGRRTHQEGLTLDAILATAAPFTGSLVIGWTAALRWDPTTVRGGMIVAPITVIVGMLLRRFVAGEGTAPSFIVVAAAFLVAGMVGWRALLTLRDSRLEHSASSDVDSVGVRP